MSILQQKQEYHQQLFTQASPNVNRYNRPYEKTVSRIFEDKDMIKSGSIKNQTDGHKTTKKLSLTEQQILSHPLIKQIVEKSKSKSICHKINEIPPKIQLYSKPLKYQYENYTAGSGPYTSSCNEKIRTIYTKMHDSKTLSEKMNLLQDDKTSISNRTQKSRPQSAKNSDNKQRISVSGLVSHNFNSVSARRSLGYNRKQNQQEKLQDELKNIKMKNSCMTKRGIQIAKRRSLKNVMHNIAVQQAASSNFDIGTQSFLSNLIKISQEQKQFYGQKWKKMKFIKKQMQQQGYNFEDAKFVINQIEKTNKVEKIKPKIEKFIINEQLELSKRRVAMSRKKVMLKQLYFVQ